MGVIRNAYKNSLFFSELKIFDRPEKPQKADLDTSRLFFKQNW